MDCPRCGRETPDALTARRHCGASPRPSLWRRLFGWAGTQQPAAPKHRSVFVSRVSTRVAGAAPVGRSGAPGQIPPDLVEELRRAVGDCGVVSYEKVSVDDGSGEVAVSERGTPLDPKVRAALEGLMASGVATSQQQIVIDADGQRRIYDCIDDVPPHLRKLLGRLADAPLKEPGF